MGWLIKVFGFAGLCFVITVFGGCQGAQDDDSKPDDAIVEGEADSSDDDNGSGGPSRPIQSGDLQGKWYIEFEDECGYAKRPLKSMRNAFGLKGDGHTSLRKAGRRAKDYEGEIEYEGEWSDYCDADFYWYAYGQELWFEEYAYSEGGDITRYYWDFGDGNTGEGCCLYHWYNSPGEYQVCLTIETSTGCTDTYCSYVSVWEDEPYYCWSYVVSMTFDGTNVEYKLEGTAYDEDMEMIASGGYFVRGSFSTDNSRTPNEIDINFTHMGYYENVGGEEYFEEEEDEFTGQGIYQFDEGQLMLSVNWESDPRPTSFDERTDFWYRLLSEADAADYESWGTWMYERPEYCEAYFWWDAYGQEVYFYNYAYASESEIISYHWDFGDGTTSTACCPTHEYASQDEYTVCLTIESESGCTDTYCRSVTVDGESDAYCEADFWYGSEYQEVWFEDWSYWDVGSITSYYWDFGDGATSTACCPTHTYADGGDYEVCLTIETSTGCMDTYCGWVYVEEASCEAYFGYDSEYQEVSFDNWSDWDMGSITSYHWDFGDGTTSTACCPTHTYADGGDYEVCLTIETSTGCMDTYCDYVNVYHVGEGE